MLVKCGRCDIIKKTVPDPETGRIANERSPTVAWHDGLTARQQSPNTVKGKGFPYSLPSVGPRADLGVQAVSSQVT